MKNTIAILFLCISSFVYAQSPYIRFSENKNQWPDQVQYRASLYGGYVYAENKGLTYQFFEDGGLSHSHAGIEKTEFSLEDIKKSLDNLQDSTIHTKDTSHNHSSQQNENISIHTYRVLFKKMNKKCEVSATQSIPGIENYYIGNDPSKWAESVRTYKRITYKNLYKKIDLELYDNKGTLKYDFIIHPRARAKKIQLQYAGIRKMEVSDDGNLVIYTSVNKVIEHKPYAFQIINGDTIDVECNYKIDDFTVSFDIEKYDKKEILYIDPELIFSTYSGSTADNWGFTATYDYENNAFAGGIVDNHGYPTNTGAYQEDFGGGSWDVGIIKYNPEGTERKYATYLGGNSAEMPHSLIVDKNNNLLILGTTSSKDFPTVHAYNSSFNGGKSIIYNNVQEFNNGTDIFVAKLNPDGTQLLASTYIGGSENDGLNFDGEPIYYGRDSLYYNYGDGARGEIMIDEDDNVYVATTTFSDDFPVVNASQSFSGGIQDAVIFKFNSTLSTLLWSTYFGGESKDAAYSVDIHEENNAVYVSGGTCSQSVSMPSGGFMSSRIGGKVDAFVLRMNKSMGALENATFYGSEGYDQAHFVRANQSGDVFIFGQTTAEGTELI
ncbi:MAG: SBBP repeat-containing protein, partial [Bacteroidales bacterium]